ncbi:Nucleotidyltransferase [Trametopsis cervina]|nr:Nucleotidyltransferase [Trametopsis cervina]
MLRQIHASTSKIINLRRCRGVRWVSKAPRSADDRLARMVTKYMDKYVETERRKANPSEQANPVPEPIQPAVALRPIIKEDLDVSTIMRIAQKKNQKKAAKSKEGETMADDREKAMQFLKQIPGIGRNRTNKIMEAGFKTIEDIQLPEFFNYLTETQQAFVRFHSAIAVTADIDVANRIQDAVSGAVIPTAEVILVGSHRRGCPSPTSTHLLLIHPAHVEVPTPDKVVQRVPFMQSKADKSPDNPTKDILDVLRRRGIIAADFRVTSHSWTGVLRIPYKDSEGAWEPQRDRVRGVKERHGEFRRVDLAMVPAASKGAAMLVLTGDDDFLKAVKSTAEKNGLFLNEFGLWRKRDGEDPLWEPLPSNTEKEILDQLGMEWVEPDKRRIKDNPELTAVRRSQYRRKY